VITLEPCEICGKPREDNMIVSKPHPSKELVGVCVERGAIHLAGHGPYSNNNQNNEPFQFYYSDDQSLEDSWESKIEVAKHE